MWRMVYVSDAEEQGLKSLYNNYHIKYDKMMPTWLLILFGIIIIPIFILGLISIIISIKRNLENEDTAAITAVSLIVVIIIVIISAITGL